MNEFITLVTNVSDWLWGVPIISLLVLSGIFLTIKLGFFQFRYPIYIFKQTFGSIFKKPKGEGDISPRQALTSALSSTVGAANIIGVPAAIMFGGPGAIFWMWVIAIIGMAIKFSESVLAVHYREKNDAGEFVGGPVYYISKGLRWKWLATWFAFALMIELIPSIMVQGNAVSSAVRETFNGNTLITGIVVAILVGIIVFGGLKRIAKVTEIVVPGMALVYVGAGLVIVLMNFSEIPNVLSLIFSYAFEPMAAFGGFAGAAVAETIRWGFARGLYSNEAGLGTAPIAHAAAQTDHPVRQGFWAVIGIVIDTLIICSTTAFVVLSSGVWTADGAMDDPAALTTIAFNEYFGYTGSLLVTISLIFFVLSTIIVIIFYGSRQAEYLFGLTAGKIMKAVYIVSIVIGSIGGAQMIWNFLDLMLAMILIPNMIAVLLLSGEVKRLTTEFFTSEKYYKKDIAEEEAS
ncbi:alanine/glycine:cation symporter family protein [Exiguobacterium profundum]|uniref:alanine/glycine:cation symporter family protein n=1 Tax=Exiguobacterium TaxID=33986 RepID=UPI0012F0DBA0|nr:MULTISPECIES: sodium:alanine symporter family protein [Exiguobacterium]QPI68585.1 sodium:alanine symporter family protein [Exiguobacterium sp. PBE]MBG0917563.1 sodium:alanine symporter family protein [Exiguobacterium sp. SRB7LM]MCT4797419.1 sodium:alanine symporter family protein [Exiguobacterium profundum]MDT0192105.1 sodium:alanine symporter family protein [Exiguobacterium sp. BG5(2022)]VXB43054.1 putative aminoacid transporter [Exiguobacterium sp. 8A]